MSRGARGALCLFFGAITLMLGSIAVVIAVPPLQVAYELTRFTPVGLYAAFVLVVAIATLILCVLAAFATLLFGGE